MNSNLFFWKERSGSNVCAETLIEALEDDVTYPGIEHLPLSTVFDAFRLEFPELQSNESSLSWSMNENLLNVTFLFRGEHHVLLTSVECSSGAKERVGRVARSLGCRIHEPTYQSGAQ